MKMSVERLKAIVLYVLNRVDDKCLGKHELFKILYFASQKHLVRYGDVMISDFYAMEYGPVPSTLCNYLRKTNNDIALSVKSDKETKYLYCAQSTRYVLRPLAEPDMGELSKVDIECLDEAIVENNGLSFKELTRKSHDSAWNSAWNNPVGKRGARMDVIEIARAAGADEQTIEYIQEELDLEAALR